ncbi:MAG: hypothetical protein KME42_14015 [Tildeniella nuda ZEHNDER 1965/U140]|nr:hypothetical protein [Tildeniella nuda ZEHNDER 1965/U140]
MPIYAGSGEVIFAKQDSFPRVRAEAPGIERSAYNTPVKYGGFLPEPHVWTLKVLAPIALQPVVQAMYDIHNDLFVKKQAAQIRLIDAYQSFNELGTRTRAVAPSPFNTVTTNTYGLTEYFAQFDVWFSKQPTFAQEGGKVIIDLAFEEYKVVPA